MRPKASTVLLTATRGDGGRYRGHRPVRRSASRPDCAREASVRHELRAAASVLGVRDVSLLELPRSAVSTARTRARLIAEHRRAPEAEFVPTSS